MARSVNIKKRLLIALAAIAILGLLAAILIPWLETMYDPALREKFMQHVDRLGVWGYLLMFGIQIVQVVIAFIPGEPVELMAGALYGGLGGLITCLMGSALASAGIFLLMRAVGKRFLTRLFTKKKLEEFGFMQDSKKLEAVTLILFLLPGTPKDMLTYVAGTTPISMGRFLAISTFARVPSVVTSTFIGDQVLSGHWLGAALLTVGTLALGLIGIFYRERALAFCRRHSPRSKSRSER